MSISITVHPYLSPRVITVDDPQAEANVQDIVDAIRAWEDSPEGQSYPKLIDAAGKEDLGGSTYVGITATLQNAQLRFEARATPLESGSITTGDSEGRTLIDTTADFITTGIYAGCTIFNLTTQSMETVIIVDSATQLTSFPLQAGTRQDWQVGDSYLVYPNEQCNIPGGNLVATDSSGNTIAPILQSPNTNIVRTSASSATLQELSIIQHSSFGDGVSVDLTSSYSGTTFPVGTGQEKVNNIADALLIAAERGFNIIYLYSDLTIATEDLSDYTIIGARHEDTVVTIAAGATLSGLRIENCHVSGTLDGDSELSNCVVGSLSYVNGYIHNSALEGTITLGGTKKAVLNNCFTSDSDSPPIIDMGASGQSLSMPNYSGTVTITNLSSGTEEVVVGLNGGRITLDSTVTAGTILVSGVGLLTDNSGGTTAVNSDSLLCKEGISESVWSHEDAVFLKDIEGGRWAITGNQMICYKEDNITEVARFDLMDESGSPASTNVVQRRRI